MNSGGNVPSIDPADEDSLTGAFRFILGKMLQDVNGMLPARVISYDRTMNRAQVQPMIAVLTTDNSQISRAPIASVPVLNLGGGGILLNFKISAGDLGWILANDRDISLFLQSYDESKPNTLRKNSFSDSLFIPHIMTGYNTVDDGELLSIQNLDGTVRIGVLADKIKITAPLGLEVDGPIAATGGISVTGGSGFSVTGNFNMTGQMHVSGDITASGDITPHVPP
jgi:hypothetical protein